MKNKKKIFFTIITPVLNGDKYIVNNIQSMKKQTYKNFEHIIVDGGSLDNSPKLIKKNMNNKNIFLSKKDKNMWDAINKAIKISKGEVIGILNSDDYYYKNALKIINRYFLKYKELDYIFGSIRKNKRILYRLEKHKINYKFNIYPSHSVSFFIKRNTQLKVGYYNTDYNLCSDYDFFYKLFNNKNLKGMNTKKNELIGLFRPGGMSENISYIKKILLELRIRFNNKQNFLYLIVLFFAYIVNFVRNKILNLF